MVILFSHKCSCICVRNRRIYRLELLDDNTATREAKVAGEVIIARSTEPRCSRYRIKRDVAQAVRVYRCTSLCVCVSVWCMCLYVISTSYYLIETKNMRVRCSSLWIGAVRRALARATILSVISPPPLRFTFSLSNPFRTIRGLE